MEYTITENSTDIRYSATILFNEPIYSYFQNNLFYISINDIISDKFIEINDFTTLRNNYGQNASLPQVYSGNKSSEEIQLDNSLVKNGGIVIDFIDENTIKVVIIPKCTDGIDTIGFYTSNIKISINHVSGFIDIDLEAKLYPKILRENNIIKLDSTAEDPVLIDDPSMPETLRPCNRFLPATTVGSKHVKYNFNYRTDNSIFVNTNHKEDISVDEVPLYISKLSACFIKNEDSDIFDPNWETIDSCLYNDKNQTKIDIDYAGYDNSIEETYPPGTEFEPQNINKLIIEKTENNGEIKSYNMNINVYKFIQYLYTENIGKFENTLAFKINTKGSTEEEE